MSQKEKKFLGNKRENSAKKEEKQKENIFLKPEPKCKINKFITTPKFRHAEPEEMKQAIENWDGKNINDLPFVSQEGSVGHQIEINVRPLLRDWVELRRKQQDVEKDIEDDLKKKIHDWDKLPVEQRDKNIISQRIDNKEWYKLNADLCKIQQNITKNLNTRKNSGRQTAPINQNLITLIYHKYGSSKAYSINTWRDTLTIDGKRKYSSYQKQNKQKTHIYTRPDVVKKIQQEHNVKGLGDLINYLKSQPENTNTYKDKDINEIIMYAKLLILRCIYQNKNKYKTITSNQAEQLSKDIKAILDTTKQQYTFAQMVGAIQSAKTTYDTAMTNILLASKLNNNNNQAGQNDLDIQLVDVQVAEIYSENGYNPFDLDLDMIANKEINNNQEHHINSNNGNVAPTITINNNTDDINNIDTVLAQDIYIKQP